MRKSEQKIWDAMKRAAPPSIWMQRVENIVGDGMPDVYVEGPWVELKAAKLPKRSTTRLQYSEGLRQSQINWHLKAKSKNMVSFILVRVEELPREPMLFLGSLAECVNDFTMDEARASAFAIGWSAIFERLSR